ncbi:hypothetical protein NDU88_003504, partial [Pleurodeles waltl]
MFRLSKGCDKLQPKQPAQYVDLSSRNGSVPGQRRTVKGRTHCEKEGSEKKVPGAWRRA